MSDLDALKKAAEAATPGPWHHVNPGLVLPATRTVHGPIPAERVDYVSTWAGLGTPPRHRVIIGRDGLTSSKDMAFIALANPATVLDLIARLEAAEEALIKAASKFADYAVSHAAKGTPDADAKAQANRDMSAMCSAALARIRGEQP